MKNKVLYAILITSLLIQCQEYNQARLQAEIEKANQEQKEKLKPDHDYLLSLRKDSYAIPHTSPTKEEAVRKYLEELLSSSYQTETGAYSYTKEELKTILYPNTLGMGTTLDTTPLRQYEDLVWDRKKMGEERIRESLRGRKFSMVRIDWKESSKAYGALVGHKPESIVVSVLGATIPITQIKQVIEHKGRFKVAIVAP